MATLKKLEKILRENAFDEKEKRCGLKFNPGFKAAAQRTPGHQRRLQFQFAAGDQNFKQGTRTGT